MPIIGITLYPKGKAVVGATGLEPAASWSQTKHSTKLSYAPQQQILLYYTAADLSSIFFFLDISLLRDMPKSTYQRALF